MFQGLFHNFTKYTNFGTIPFSFEVLDHSKFTRPVEKQQLLNSPVDEKTLNRPVDEKTLNTVLWTCSVNLL